MTKPLKVRIATKNKYLYQKLFLELQGDEFEISSEECDLTLCDIDTEEKIPGAKLISYSSPEADILMPQRLGKIRELLSSRAEIPLSLSDEERCVFIYGEKIKLTELEFSLFSLLFHRADFVSREEILDTVWHGAADSGIINVYVHYLREKLEKGGERIIISSRKSGYRINETYLGGKENA